MIAGQNRTVRPLPTIRDVEVAGWSARISDHADYLIVSVSTSDAAEAG